MSLASELVGREKPPTLAEAVELVIEATCRMPMDSFRDAPERWRDKFGALQATLSVLASTRDREKERA